MADLLDKPARYEVTPVRLAMPAVGLPGRPFFAQEVGRKLRRRPIRSWRTRETSVQDAAAATLTILGSYRWKIRKDVRHVRELLELNALLIGLPWVVEAEMRRRRMKRVPRLKGRSKWRYHVDPSVVLGVVWALQKSGRVKNEHQATVWLGKHTVLSYHEARRLLKAAKKDPRLQPLLLPRPEVPIPSAEEFQALLDHAITVEPGQVIRYGFDGEEAKLVSVTHLEDPTDTSAPE